MNNLTTQRATNERGRPTGSPAETAFFEAFPADLRKKIRGLDRHKWTIVVFACAVVAAVTAWTLRQAPVYEATATVLVDLRAPSVLGRDVEQVEELGTGSYWNNQEYLETQNKIITSREVASRVVTKLRLDRATAFDSPEKEGRTAVDLAERLRNGISAESIRDTRLIKISYQDTDAERARDIANATADVYLEQNVARMLSATVSAVNWLSRQANDLQEQLEASERALYEFRQEHDILSISLEDRQNIIANKIQKLSAEATAARTRRIKLAADIVEMRNFSKLRPMEMPVIQLIDNGLIQHLKEQYSQLTREIESLAKRYGSNWPRIREIRAECEGIEVAISREVSSILESQEAELRAAERAERGIEGALTEVQQEALALNIHEVRYNRLDRTQKNHAKMYELVLGRSTETDLARLLRVNNLRILDPATLPRTPVKPRVPLNITLAIILGILGGIALALTIDMLDLTVKSPADVEMLGAPFLGILPSFEDSASHTKRGRNRTASGGDKEQAKELYVHQHSKSTVAEAARSIRTNLLFMDATSMARSMLVTSPGPREGKTTVATSLAIVMAQSGSRTIIVDTDLRRPRISRAVGVNQHVGITSVIVGQVTLDEAIQQTAVPGLSVLPCGPIPPNPAELLHSEKFGQIVAELSSKFDRVIFDTPPMGAVTDAAILAAQIDGVAFVLRVGQTRKDGANRALTQLDEIGAKILGVVLNKVDLRKREYGYYSYYYRRGAKGGYYSYSADASGS